MADLPPEAAFGTGLAFEQDWDVDITSGGSIGLVDGVDVLGRDLAFALLQAAEEAALRGRSFSPELREDARIVVRDVVTSDSRVASIESVTVAAPDTASDTIEVQLAIVAATGERGEFVFTV